MNCFFYHFFHSITFYVLFGHLYPCSIWTFISLFCLDFYIPCVFRFFFSIFFILFQLFLFFNLRFYKIFILRGIYQQIQFDKEDRMSLQNLFDPIVSVLFTLVKSSIIYTGQYTFPILLLNDDNMLGEHKGRQKNIVYGRLF